MRRAGLIVGAVACFALALAFIFLAVDVLRWRNALRADDVRYRVAPAASDLWHPTALVPFGVARDLLGVNDDVAYRQGLRALRISRFEEATNTSPTAVLRRADAQQRLLALSAAGNDPARRSQAFGLLAVLGLSTPSATPQERAAVLKAAVVNLVAAILLDPSNDDAKYNLEVALRRSRGVQTQQGGPTPNSRSKRGGQKGAATGPPSSGY